MKGLINFLVLVGLLNFVFGKILYPYSWLPDLMLLVVSIIISLSLLCGKTYRNHYVIRMSLTFMVTFSLCKIVISESVFAAVSSFYRVVLLQILVLVNVDYGYLNGLLRRAFVFARPLLLLGVLQFFFFSYLPRFWVSSDFSNDHVDGIYSGLNVGVRANGFFGNPLEFGAVFVLGSLLGYTKMRYSFVSALITLSRGAFIMNTLLLLKQRKGFVIVFLLAVASVFLNFGIFNRLLFRTQESLDSSSSRLDYLGTLLDMDFFTILFGSDLGSVSARGSTVNSIEIYDGYFLNVIVEYGLFFCILYIITFASHMLRTRRYTLFVYWVFFNTISSAFLHPFIATVFYLSLSRGYEK